MKDTVLLISNTAWQGLSKVASLAISILTITVLTRYLGTSGYGDFNLIFAYLSFFGVLADLGVNLLFVREYSKNNKASLSHFFVSKLILVLISLIASLSVIPFLPYTAIVKVGVFIGALAVSIGYLNGFGYSILQSEVKLNTVAIYEAINRIVTVSFLLLFIYLDLGLLFIILSVLLGNLLSLVISLITIKGFLPRNWDFSWSGVRKTIAMAVPIGITSIFSALYFRIDTVILSFYRPSSEVGVYSLAYKVFENIIVLWGLYIASFYPLAAKYFHDSDKRKLKGLIRKTIIFLVIVSFCVLISGYTFGPKLLLWLAGEKFELSIKPMMILFLGIPFFLINNVYYHLLLIVGKIKIILYCMIFSFVINILLNFYFIPNFGYLGASFTTISTEIVLSIVYLAVIKTTLKKL